MSEDEMTDQELMLADAREMISSRVWFVEDHELRKKSYIACMLNEWNTGNPAPPPAAERTPKFEDV